MMEPCNECGSIPPHHDFVVGVDGNVYCDYQCEASHRHYKEGVNFPCANCRKNVFPGRIFANGDKLFCSIECYAAGIQL